MCPPPEKSAGLWAISLELTRLSLIISLTQPVLVLILAALPRLPSVNPLMHAGQVSSVINDVCEAIVSLFRLIEEYIDTRYDLTFYDRFCSWEVAMGSYIVKNTQFSRTFLMNFANFETHLPDSFHGSDNGAIHVRFGYQYNDDCNS